MDESNNQDRQVFVIFNPGDLPLSFHIKAGIYPSLYTRPTKDKTMDCEQPRRMWAFSLT
jgi:hypothetical protein